MEKKYCRRREIFLFHLGNFCPCCGMALSGSPASRNQKEKPRIHQIFRSQERFPVY
jgi:hypothetical protein